ncbi:hypothetical protein CY34DRAFT_26216 [Suillus luteus UH-Slu-Lm8-n1]|uniref:Uncharacterized protein n=1 Tax=Suillus luteus UH-Slu-Lm8-n1 TaxID=930992 RepID=A0A0D0A5E2_9AGAM|nr:hypothetical protein CY34DRAFT_26216 [Suillus luteus UH-Slu-Lm8-n1]
MDIRVLQLVKELFVCLAPNVTGWCDAFTVLLDGMGYRICRRFNNTYHWYCILLLFSCRQIQEGLEHVHSDYRNPPHKQDAEYTKKYEEHVEKDAEDDKVAWCPLEYLRGQCQLCYGAQDWRLACSTDCSIDAIGCIDACFNQKCMHAHDNDPKNPTESFFISKSKVQEMEVEVKAEDGYEDGMCIPTLVLEANTQFFSDIGVMALLYRHDCVLWLVNMTSAGEKQHYALALIRR